MKKPHRVKQETIHEMKIKTKNTEEHRRLYCKDTIEEGTREHYTRKKCKTKEEPKRRKTHNVTMPTFHPKTTNSSNSSVTNSSVTNNSK